jgi:uncharacterized membrane protein YeaQ/YmgE (transglycosylase-associated protein family)
MNLFHDTTIPCQHPFGPVLPNLNCAPIAERPLRPAFTKPSASLAQSRRGINCGPANLSRCCLCGFDRPPNCPYSDRETLSMIGWIVFGLIVGIIAKLLMPGRDPGGFIITILLGIAGAILGGFIGRAIGFYGPNQSAGFMMSILGAILLLTLYRFLGGGRRHWI